jgi:hypothetical protein
LRQRQRQESASRFGIDHLRIVLKDPLRVGPLQLTDDPLILFTLMPPLLA